MRTNQTRLVTLIFIAFTASDTLSQQNHLDIEGHVMIRGNIDINHMDDTTSVIIGIDARINTDFSNSKGNTFVGSTTGYSNTTGDSNSFFGRAAGFYNTTGLANSFFGRAAGYYNTTGILNSFFGQATGFNNTTGDNDSFSGFKAGFMNTSGHSNSFFGQEAGFSTTTGNRNTFIGSLADQLFFIDSLDRATAIGFNAKVGCSHCLVLGGTGEDTVRVGIGTTNPTAILDVRGTAIINNPIAGGVIEVLGPDGTTAAIKLFEGVGFGFELQYDGGSGVDKLYLRSRKFTGNEAIRMTWLKDGKVGIGTTSPTTQLHTTGAVRFSNFGAGTVETDANGNLTVSSDIHLKENIVSYTRGLSEIVKIEPITYQWIEESGLDTEHNYSGFSAQNIRDVIPEAVNIDSRGYLTLSDRPILAALVNSVIELNTEKEEMRKEYHDRLEQQQSEIDILKREMAELRILLQAQIEQGAGEE